MTDISKEKAPLQRDTKMGVRLLKRDYERSLSDAGIYDQFHGKTNFGESTQCSCAIEKLLSADWNGHPYDKFAFLYNLDYKNDMDRSRIASQLCNHDNLHDLVVHRLSTTTIIE